MISGSLWDETLQWLVETVAKISTGEKIDYTLKNNSTKWGNHTNATFEYTNTSGGTNTKNKGSDTRIPTGSTDYTKANKIYDMAGNVYEWTLEVDYTNSRVLRGGSCYYDNISGSDPVRNRNTNGAPTISAESRGSRCVLYIK